MKNWTLSILLVVTMCAVLWRMGLLGQALAVVMTVILHPWILAPIVVVAIVIVLLMGLFSKNRQE